MAEKVPTEVRKAREQARDVTWEALKKRGFKRPKDAEENARRLKEAHGY